MTKKSSATQIEMVPDVHDRDLALFGAGRAANLDRLADVTMQRFEVMVEAIMDSCTAVLTAAGMTLSHGTAHPWVLACRAQAFVEEFHGKAPLEVVYAAHHIAALADLEWAITSFRGNLDRGIPADDAFAAVIVAAIAAGFVDTQGAYVSFQDDHGKMLGHVAVERAGASASGKARANKIRRENEERDERVRAHYVSLRSNNPRITANGFAERHCGKCRLRPSTIRRILKSL